MSEIKPLIRDYDDQVNIDLLFDKVNELIEKVTELEKLIKKLN